MEQKQIDALRAMLADATPGEWYERDNNVFSPCEEEFSHAIVCKGAYRNAVLIAAMHNAMPALLDAAQPAAASVWRTDAPPRDGTTFLVWTEKSVYAARWSQMFLKWLSVGRGTFFIPESIIIAWAAIAPYEEGTP